MKIVLHYQPGLKHQEQHARLMSKGMRRHGEDTAFAANDKPVAADLVVVWGWRQRIVIEAAQARGTPILVMERGHLQPRMEWVSCGFGGIGHRAIYPKAADGGRRWERHFSRHLQPWRNGGSFALVCGQLPGDAALGGTDVHRWVQDTVDALAAKDIAVRFRPHPLRDRIGDAWDPVNAEISSSSLAEDLAGADFVVTYNSTSGVESVLAGKPTITCDVGSMAWPVTTHALDEPRAMPDRSGWCHDLAWTQWQADEIGKGTAWEALRSCISSPTPE
jgi:hypothetical protein